MKKLGEYTVGEVMSRDTIVISQFDRITDAVRLMEENGISALPVTDEHGCVMGIITLFDLIGITREIQSDLAALSHVDQSTGEFLIGLLKESGGQTLVGDVMTTPIHTVKASDNLVVAARELVKLGFRHLPVVDDEHRPAGMLSTTDFVKAFAESGALMAG